MMTDSIKNLNSCLHRSLRAMKPPENITVSQWADKNMILSAEASAETGKYRTSRTPYMKEIMDAFTDPNVQEITVVAASQVGKSATLNNIIGYVIDQDPSSMLFVHPSIKTAEEYMELRIDPMIRDVPCIRNKVAARKSRSSGNTKRSKKYPGGILTATGSNVAEDLAGKPIRIVLCDEVDRFAKSAGREGDPIALAKKRQKTFYNRKLFCDSTPTIAGDSKIAEMYEEGTRELYCTKCPHCGKYTDVRFKHIRFNHDVVEGNGGKTYTVKDVYFACPECGGASTEYEIKHSESKWIAQSPEAIKNGKRSFWLNAFVSPWADWKSIILEFLESKDEPAKLQVVFNTLFGELWEDRGDIESEDSLLARREDYGYDDSGEPLELPEGVLALTMGVDTQNDRLEYEVVGWGRKDISWGIRYGIIFGRPDDPATWEKLDEVLDKRYRYHDGVSIPISLTFMDEGGSYTKNVRTECCKRIGKGLYAVKGFSQQGMPYTAKPKRLQINKDDSQDGYFWQYQINVDSGKEMFLNDRIKRKDPDSRGYCHFPRRNDYGAGYFFGLLSEHFGKEANSKKKTLSWIKIPGHERNEPLDCRNYAQAAHDVLVMDCEKLEHELHMRRSKDASDPLEQPSTVQQKAKSPQRPRTRSNGAVITDGW